MRVAGIGFRGAATQAALQDAFDKAVGDGPRPQAIVTEAAKARAPVFREFATSLGLPGLGVTTEDLGQMITPTQSERIQDKFGTGSLCEAAALAMAGPDAVLVAGRKISDDGMATAAIADQKGQTT